MAGVRLRPHNASVEAEHRTNQFTASKLSSGSLPPKLFTAGEPTTCPSSYGTPKRPQLQPEIALWRPTEFLFAWCVAVYSCSQPPCFKGILKSRHRKNEKMMVKQNRSLPRGWQSGRATFKHSSCKKSFQAYSGFNTS